MNIYKTIVRALNNAIDWENSRRDAGIPGEYYDADYNNLLEAMREVSREKKFARMFNEGIKDGSIKMLGLDEIKALRTRP